MERKDFIKKGILGTIMLSAGAKASSDSEIEKTSQPEIVGFNHIKNTNSKIMENIVLHKADQRGHANHGWLNAYHSFSFANYYNPEKMNFGVLRVLNDDTIAAGMGFGTHPHDNMEIITIPLEGDLEHKDSMGNSSVIKHGDIQVMSAGTGIRHSEYNKRSDLNLKLLQIWLMPNKRNVTPRYDQITLNVADRHNNFQQILSPNPDDAGVWIHQNAWFHLGKFDKNHSEKYQLKDKTNGVYAFVINGSVNINGQILDKRDAMGTWAVDSLNINALSADSEVLLMEVPMTI
jgi:quercetin 2,3-dioxygenase